MTSFYPSYSVLLIFFFQQSICLLITCCCISLSPFQFTGIFQALGGLSLYVVFLGCANHSPIWRSLSGTMSLAFRQQRLPLLPNTLRSQCAGNCAVRKERADKAACFVCVLWRLSGQHQGEHLLCSGQRSRSAPIIRAASPHAPVFAVCSPPSPPCHPLPRAAQPLFLLPLQPWFGGCLPSVRSYDRLPRQFPSRLSILPRLHLPAAACSVLLIYTR